MKSLQIRKKLTILDMELRTHIKDIGISEAVKQTGIKQPDISAWINRKRNWTHNKILDIADRLGL